MAKNKVYKVHKSKLKNDTLLKYGFSLFTDNGNEIVYAIPITLELDSDIVLGLKNVMQDTRFIAQLTDEQKQDFQYEDGKIILTDDLKAQLTHCELCVSLGETEDDWTRGMLFLNSPDKTPYYNKIILDNHCKDIIQCLKDNKVIYEKSVKD